MGRYLTTHWCLIGLGLEEAKVPFSLSRATSGLGPVLLSQTANTVKGIIMVTRICQEEAVSVSLACQELQRGAFFQTCSN